MRVPSGAVVLAVAVVLLLAAAAVFVLPEALVPSSARLTDAERYGLENSVRTTLLQAIGGALLLAGAFFTWRQVLISQRQLDVARQGQVTERFTRAIDQLGSDSTDVRVGGIYALESLAGAAEDQRVQVVEVLAAFVRVHAPRDPEAEAEVGEGPDEEPLVDPVRGPVWLPLRRRLPDVQVALQVIGRLRNGRDPVLMLSDTDLRRSDLRRTCLVRAWLTGSSLRVADVRGADLRRARLTGSDLSGLEAAGATLEHAALEGVRLRRANLSGCNLREADLRHADLTGAVLTGAQVAGAKLEGAVLDWADLRGVDLGGAVGLTPGQTEGAFTDQGPALPEGTLARARTLAARARTLAIAAPHWEESVMELSRLLDGDRAAAERALVDCIGCGDALMTRRIAVRLLVQAMSEGRREDPSPHLEDAKQQT